MRDWCFRPECLERFLEIFPHAEVHRLNDAGHYVVEDAYEQIVPLVRTFLEAHPLASGDASPSASSDVADSLAHSFYKKAT
jgi:haloalkane dehalogenase